jgi:hypothetical protein
MDFSVFFEKKMEKKKKVNYFFLYIWERVLKS